MSFRPTIGRKTLFIAIAIVGAYYAYFGLTALPFGYRVTNTECETLEVEYVKLSSELGQARRLAADRPRVERMYSETHARWSGVREVLPDQDEMAGLLRRITMAGETSGVTFYLFKPLAPIPATFYFENPVEVSVVGGYHEVATFLGEIAALPRLVNVQGLHLVSFDGEDPDDAVEASFTASAYSVMGPQGKIPGETGAAKSTAAQPRRAGHGSSTASEE